MFVVNLVVGCLCIITISAIALFTKWIKEILSECDEPTEIKIKLINDGALPEIKTEGDVCFDAKARLGKTTCILEPNCRTLIPLGFAVELPDGYEAVVRPRSGNSKKGIDVCIGTIDTDYRGEVVACVVNNSDKNFAVHNGDRICQIAIREVPNINFVTVDELSETERGSKGFGSSGLK